MQVRQDLWRGSNVPFLLGGWAIADSDYRAAIQGVPLGMLNPGPIANYVGLLRVSTSRRRK